WRAPNAAAQVPRDAVRQRTLHAASEARVADIAAEARREATRQEIVECKAVGIRVDRGECSRIRDVVADRDHRTRGRARRKVGDADRVYSQPRVQRVWDHGTVIDPAAVIRTAAEDNTLQRAATPS